MLKALFARELKLALRRRADALSGLMFFFLVGSLFPLAIGPDAALLSEVAPGVVWVAALLAVLLSMHRLFEQDAADGSLEQWMLAPRDFAGLIVGKVAACWCVACLPLIAVAPLLALQYGLATGPTSMLILTLLLGTPTLVLIGALGAALTLGLRGPVALALVVLPMSVPPLVFGCAAVKASQEGLPAAPSLGLLGACLSLALVLCPHAIAASLRLALE